MSRLVRGVDAVFAEIAQRAGEARRSPCRGPPLFSGAVVHVVAKFNVGIERARRLPPAERDVAAEFGADHVADEQRVGVEPIGRKRAELVLPLADESAGSHFKRDEAERRCLIALSAAVRETRSGIEFGVDAPDFPERQPRQSEIGVASASSAASFGMPNSSR